MPPTRPERRQIGPLNAIDFPAAKDAPVLLCLHGYGADAADLAPLAMELPVGKPLRWVFPDAPLALDSGPFPAGRMWFPIDVSEIERAQREGKTRDFSGERPAGFDESLSSARAMIDALGVPWERLIIGGFSQGSMMAVELALGAPAAPRGLFILSGNLVDEDAVRRRAAALAGTPFFQSHGGADPLLGFAGAERLGALLREAGLKGDMLRFDGGHALPPEALGPLKDFIEKLL